MAISFAKILLIGLAGFIFASDAVLAEEGGAPSAPAPTTSSVGTGNAKSVASTKRDLARKKKKKKKKRTHQN